MQEVPVSDQPGFIREPYVISAVKTPVGDVPIVTSKWQRTDFRGGLKVRLGINRSGYCVVPGLYGIGHPDPDSPVLVTANYKLSFDILRRDLAGLDAWVLVLETNGVNVWCAAGKGNFSTRELVSRVHQTGLAKVVNHRRLILPQLSATGVAAHAVRKGCGFSVTWGPIHSNDIRAFLENRFKTTPTMRQLSFSLKERLVLVPVEVNLVLKRAFWICLALVVLSGFGPGVYSFGNMWPRGGLMVLSVVLGILSGAVLAPMLLPWLPGRAFSLKGIWTGILAGLVLVVAGGHAVIDWEAAAILLSTTALSSYLAMNFTGSTPFTSPSGVEKEMRRSIPVQLLMVVAALAAWGLSAFFP